MCLIVSDMRTLLRRRAGRPRARAGRRGFCFGRALDHRTTLTTTFLTTTFRRRYAAYGGSNLRIARGWRETERILGPRGIVARKHIYTQIGNSDFWGSREPHPSVLGECHASPPRCLVFALSHALCVIRRWSCWQRERRRRGPMEGAKTLSRNGSKEFHNGMVKLRETPALRYRLLLVFGLFLVWL